MFSDHGIYNTVSSIGVAKKWGLKKEIFSKPNICNDSLICPIEPDMKCLYTEHIDVPGWVPKVYELKFLFFNIFIFNETCFIIFILQMV